MSNDIRYIWTICQSESSCKTLILNEKPYKLEVPRRKKLIYDNNNNNNNNNNDNNNGNNNDNNLFINILQRHA